MFPGNCLSASRYPLGQRAPSPRCCFEPARHCLCFVTNCSCQICHLVRAGLTGPFTPPCEAFLTPSLPPDRGNCCFRCCHGSSQAGGMDLGEFMLCLVSPKRSLSCAALWSCLTSQQEGKDEGVVRLNLPPSLCQSSVPAQLQAEPCSSSAFSAASWHI